MFALKNKLSNGDIGIIVGASLGVLTLPFLIEFFSHKHFVALLIIFFFALLLALPPLLAIYKKEFDPFEPVYLWIVLYGFLYLLKPLVQILNGAEFRYGEEYLNQALLIAIMGLISFYLGYFWNRGEKIAEMLPVVARDISLKKLKLVAWIFIIIGFWGLNTYIQISGGWLAFWSKPHGFGGKAEITTAYIYQLPELMVIGFILIFFATKNLFYLLLAGLGGVGIYTLIWGSRTNFSWILLSCIIIYYLQKKSRPSLKTIFSTLLTLLVALSIIPIYRSQVHIGGDWKKILSTNYASAVRSSFNPMDEFNAYLAEVALVPQEIPYDYFALHRNLVFHPIPRLIWPEKPPLFNRNWSAFLAKSHLNWGAAESLLGDFYAQLGLIGVIIGTFVSGVVWKIIYWYLKRDEKNRGAIIIFAIALPNMFTFLAQGSAIAILKWLPYMMPSTILAVLLSRTTSKEQRT